MPFKTRETVDTETPADLATSLIVMVLGFRFIFLSDGDNVSGIDTDNVIVIIAKK